MTRGIRNNNPANIRRGSAWFGLSKEQNDKSFCQFDNITYGVRAFLVLMRTYHYKYKLNTIEKILYRFAPLSENNTYAYIAFVTKFMNDNQDDCYIGSYKCKKVVFTQDFNVNNWFNSKEPCSWLVLFARAIFKMECGKDFTNEDIEKAIEIL